MKLSPFMKQVKKWLKKLTKKQLIERVITWIEIWAQENISNWEAISGLQDLYKSISYELELTEWFLKSAESALSIYENMSILQFIKHKYGWNR